jgi:hypothetical protein
MAFVATSGPANWKLGKWSQVDGSTWQEQKFDNPKITYQFKVIDGPGTSNTLRLKLTDQNTEVLLCDSTALIFVNGSYFGEYTGQWTDDQAPSGYTPAQAPVQSSNKAAPPVSSGPVSAGNSMKAAPPAPAGNQTGGPVAGAKGAPPAQQQAMQQTQLPPGRQPGPPAPAVGGKGDSKGASSAPTAPSKGVSQLAPMPSSNRKTKADGLDKSPASIQKLIDAAGKGDVATVKQLLESGIDPDGPAKDGKTPLMAAASSGSIPVIEALVEACADPTLGKGAETPLTIAFQKGKQDVLKALFAASFQHLDGQVGPGVVYDPRYSLSKIAKESEDVPQTAIDDLRDITQKLAHMNSGGSSSSPKGGQFGNYTELMAGYDTEDKDSDLLREESVRLAMKSLVKTQKAAKEIETNLH